MSLRITPPPGGVLADLKPRESEIRAVVTRADGRVEDMGRIAYYHRNPLRNFFGNVGVAINRLLQKRSS